MKVIKKLIYFIMTVIIASCVAVLVCALNPGLTNRIAGLMGTNQNSSEEQQEEEADWIPRGGDYAYIVPESMPESVPEEVGRLYGFEPIIVEESEVDQEEADNLADVLSPGETGTEYTFSEELYPYYGMLDGTMRQLYHQVYANALELNTSFVPIQTVTANQAKRVVEAVYYDHPELFWMDGKYSCKYLSTGVCVEISLYYNSLVRNLQQARTDFEACASEILQGTERMGSDREKEKYIHDVLLKIVVYDKNADWNQSAYSAIVRGNTVCAGYTRAFQYLMQSMGIPCYYCTGFAGEDHAWNIVKLGDRFYNTDVTWDDTDPATYDYYNKTDDDFHDTHVRTGMSIYLPACVEQDAVAENEEQQGGSDIDAYINPNPQVPLTWQSRGDREEDEISEDEAAVREELRKLGIAYELYAPDMEAYLKLCSGELKKAGLGGKQFITVIPEKLWSEVEKSYSSGAYKKGYVEDALKELKAESFAIQLQVQRLGNGFYRLYHNVYTE